MRNDDGQARPGSGRKNLSILKGLRRGGRGQLLVALTLAAALFLSSCVKERVGGGEVAQEKQSAGYAANRTAEGVVATDGPPLETTIV